MEKNEIIAKINARLVGLYQEREQNRRNVFYHQDNYKTHMNQSGGYRYEDTDLNNANIKLADTDGQIRSLEFTLDLINKIDNHKKHYHERWRIQQN